VVDLDATPGARGTNAATFADPRTTCKQPAHTVTEEEVLQEEEEEGEAVVLERGLFTGLAMVEEEELGMETMAITTITSITATICLTSYLICPS